MYKATISKSWGAALLGMAVMLTGCLKDIGYEDGEYNTLTGQTTGRKFISIPLAANKPNVVGVEAKAGFQDLNLFRFSYDYHSPATENMNVTVAVKNELVTAVDPTLVLLPAAAYQIPSMTASIKPGQVISDPFIIKLNTNLLDPTKKYGIGISITDVPAGVEKSSNLNDAVFAFTIKNKYDGIYSIRCHMMHPPDRSADWTRTPFTYAFDIHMITTGPNSVKMLNTAFNAGFHPLHVPGASGFGQTEPTFTFDATDKLISVTNTFSPVTNGRAFEINPAVTTSKFEVSGSTKKIYAAFIMTQTGFQPMPIFDTLTFIKARP